MRFMVSGFLCTLGVNRLEAYIAALTPEELIWAKPNSKENMRIVFRSAIRNRFKPIIH